MSIRQSGLGYGRTLHRNARLAGHTVRAALPSDGDALAVIYNETVAGGSNSPCVQPLAGAVIAQDIETYISNKHPFLVMLVDEEIVAYFVARPMTWSPQACYHTADVSLYVKSSWWGSAVALLAMTRLYDAVRKRGFENITCWILGDNVQSLALAKAFGLAPWADLKGVVRTHGKTSDLRVYGVSVHDMEFITQMAAMRERAGKSIATAVKRLSRMPQSRHAEPIGIEAS